MSSKVRLRKVSPQHDMMKDSDVREEKRDVIELKQEVSLPIMHQDGIHPFLVKSVKFL